MPTRAARATLAIRRTFGTPTLHPHMGQCHAHRTIRSPVCQARRLPRHRYSIANELRLVKGLGADEVFDYRDESVVQKIHAATDNALDFAVDTVSEGKTPEQVTSAIGDKGRRVANNHSSAREPTRRCEGQVQHGT